MINQKITTLTKLELEKLELELTRFRINQLELIWVGGGGVFYPTLPPPPVGFLLITQKR